MPTFILSPTLAPTYSCGSSVSVIDIDDDSAFISTLNPGANEFVPSFYPIDDNSEEARRVDDILHSVHHLVSVYDSEQLMYAQQFAEADVPIDDLTDHFLDQEEAMYHGLHVPAQKPKGCTYGRKGRGSRASRERRRSREDAPLVK